MNLKTESNESIVDCVFEFGFTLRCHSSVPILNQFIKTPVERFPEASTGYSITPF